MSEEILLELGNKAMRGFPQKPFQCAPLSAMYYAVLNDEFNIDCRLVSGDLSFNGTILFKQKKSPQLQKTDGYLDFQGHFWVEVENKIVDLSLFRTVYSPEFNLPCKKDFIEHFGEGRGFMIATYEQAKNNGLIYTRKEEMDDSFATSIIKGVGNQISLNQAQ